PSTERAYGTAAGSRDTQRRGPQEAHRRADARGAGGLVPPAAPAREDRHPAGRTRRTAPTDAGEKRPRRRRRRIADGDSHRQGRRACLTAPVYCPEGGYTHRASARSCAKCGAARVAPEEGESTEAFDAPEVPESLDPLEDLGIIHGAALIVRSGGGRSGET